MKDFEIFLMDKASYELEYASCRAKNLAEEIIVGWTDQTNLAGFEHSLTMHALEYYNDAIQDRLTETHHDKFARDTIALCSRKLSWEMQKVETSMLGMTKRCLQLAR